MGWRGSPPTIRMQFQRIVPGRWMASLDSVSLAILLGAVLVLAGILSSLLALRFGAPLLLVFLAIGIIDRFAIFLTLLLVEYISLGSSSPGHVLMEFVLEAALGALVGFFGGRLVVIALNKVALPQGLHAPFVTTAALVIFGGSQIMH